MAFADVTEGNPLVFSNSVSYIRSLGQIKV